jgi:hypothetical protein
MPDPVDPATMAEIQAKLAEPRACGPDGYSLDGGYRRPIWTPLGFLRRGHRYMLRCSCGHRAEAPLQALVDRRKGDMPMHTFSWSCSKCEGGTITPEPDPA